MIDNPIPPAVDAGLDRRRRIVRVGCVVTFVVVVASLIGFQIHHRQQVAAHEQGEYRDGLSSLAVNLEIELPGAFGMANNKGTVCEVESEGEPATFECVITLWDHSQVSYEVVATPHGNTWFTATKIATYPAL